ncbi:hypothetical protein Pmani_005720 [Petrolisthes manimaculis]|uniref:Uncharacterized protein n=1 Tax=Petrolisthes manimaculis TaxID=1843537 RepID=A0AAE1QCE8_9EUCA|nr:hypothetical protein Pmani_005720 [Petrolisthes manimaculis]
MNLQQPHSDTCTWTFSPARVHILQLLIFLLRLSVCCLGYRITVTRISVSGRSERYIIAAGEDFLGRYFGFGRRGSATVAGRTAARATSRASFLVFHHMPL